MSSRTFLFLQGPHGPFFSTLARHLQETGATVVRIGFNAGDRTFWNRRLPYFPFSEIPAEWPGFLTDFLTTHSVTDLVVYGEGRAIHDQAISIARQRNIGIHIFEEGYIRPYWITYERDGSNGNSPLCNIPVSAMRSEVPSEDAPNSAAGWGELKQHIFYGALYHAAVMIGRPFYRNFRSHRDISVVREALLNIGQVLARPWQALERRASTARLRLSGKPYHLVLLQLEHDASFRGHAPYSKMADFVDEAIDAFARGAPKHHHLVFKAHPLEDGRGLIKRAIRKSSGRLGLSGRVHFLRGGKLAGLLDDTLSAVTINSTAGQQVLRRGIALKAMGQAVYSRKGMASDQSLVEFFSDPQKPDLDTYNVFRRYQLETCQIPGGFYSTVGRARLMRRIVDAILAPNGPYARTRTVAQPQRHLHLVANHK